MHKMTQAEFDALKRDERGYIHIPDNTDCTSVDFKGIDKIAFGEGCKLGNGCTLGNVCTLGDCCTLGNDCTLGNWCRLGKYCTLGKCCTLGDGGALSNGCALGERCKLGELTRIGTNVSFESGQVNNGIYIKIGNIGSENREAYFFIDSNEKMFVRAGCWFSEIDEFVKRVREVHDGTIHEVEYLTAVEYAKKVLPEKLKWMR